MTLLALLVTDVLILAIGINLGLWYARRQFSKAVAEMEDLTAQLESAHEQLRAGEPFGISISENRVSLWASSEQMRADA